ncbi:MAG TPA: hypothetical protein PLF61_07765 [Candidatus Goldiibacteriota bacterium]|nr:hypothetical protein [Candidatus Goldiibacteriota bacterium]
MRKIMCFMAMFFLFIDLHSDTIVLKDDQTFEADVIGFDSYYVTLRLLNNIEVSIPWNEIRRINHTTTSKNWMEDVYITNDDAKVTTLVSPLSTGVALQKAAFPGFFIHGAGHFYAKDQNTGFTLLSAEILSLILMAVSFSEIVSGDEKNQSYNVQHAIFYSGLVVFGGTWLYDMIFSQGAVKRYNQENEDKFLIKDDKNYENSTGQ